MNEQGKEGVYCADLDAYIHYQYTVSVTIRRSTISSSTQYNINSACCVYPLENSEQVVSASSTRQGAVSLHHPHQ